MPNAVKSPRPNRVAQFLGAKLREPTWSQRASSAVVTVKGATIWAKLFDNPQADRSSVEAAWSQILDFSRSRVRGHTLETV